MSTSAHESTPEWASKILAVRSLLSASPTTTGEESAQTSQKEMDVDASSISQALTETDGNVEEAVKVINRNRKRKMMPDTQVSEGYVVGVGGESEGQGDAEGEGDGDLTPKGSPKGLGLPAGGITGSSSGDGMASTTTSATTPSLAGGIGGIVYQPPSGTPPAPSTATAEPHANSNTNSDTPIDPQLAEQVSELKMMFPTVDNAVISAVLETHLSLSNPDERLDSAVGDLLQLTDPEYKPPATARTGAGTGTGTGTGAAIDLDEEFARSLAIQDQEAMERLQAQEHGRRQGQAGGAYGVRGDHHQSDLPYQPRQSRRTPWGSENASAGGVGPDQQYEARTDEYDDHGYPRHSQQQGQGTQFEEKFQQFAEVGKQKIDSFWNKARSKYGEFQHAQQQRQQQQGGQHGSGQGGGVVGGIGETLGGLWSDATAVATGRGTKQGGGDGSPTDWGSGTAGGSGGSAAAGPGGGRSAYGRQNPYAEHVVNSSSNNNNSPPPPSRRWQPTDTADEDAHLSRSVDVYHPGSGSGSRSGLGARERSPSRTSSSSSSDDFPLGQANSSAAAAAAPADSTRQIPKINAPSAITSRTTGTGATSSPGGLLQADRASSPGRSTEDVSGSGSPANALGTGPGAGNKIDLGEYGRA